jgi:hypothetical protein
MRCPGCRDAMHELTVEGVLGMKIDVCACLTCRAFWFEPFETLHLTRAATLKLFRVIADQASAPAPAFPTDCFCPVCEARLLLTHDRQRSTAFQYWRCDSGHGRFTAFVDFLREKEFIRPLSPQQITELRQNIQMISCSNCGAPIDLTHETACSHCGAQLSMLDATKLRELATEAARPVALQPPVEMRQERSDMSALFASRPASSGAQPEQSLSNLIDLGLRTVAQWLRDVSDQ